MTQTAFLIHIFSVVTEWCLHSAKAFSVSPASKQARDGQEIGKRHSQTDDSKEVFSTM